MSLAGLSERSGLPERGIEEVVNGDKELDEKTLAALAKALHVEPHVLLVRSSPKLVQAIDFRKNNPRPSPMPDGVVNAIGYVEKLSESLVGLSVDLSLSAEFEAYDGSFGKKDARRLAKKWRSKWGITNEEQIELRSAHKLYSSLRGYIESIGIFVMHQRFGSEEYAGAYLKVGKGPHAILINTGGQSKARKLFTLAHELCHVIIGKTGLSNSAIAKNKIETFCNQFAAYLLVPREALLEAIQGRNDSQTFDSDSFRRLANRLGVSNQCVVLRLVDEDFIDESQYIKWISMFKGRVPTLDAGDPPGRGGGADTTIQAKRTKYGTALLSKISEAAQRGKIDQIDIYYLIGLKPKYQRDLFEGI